VRALSVGRTGLCLVLCMVFAGCVADRAARSVRVLTATGYGLPASGATDPDTRRRTALEAARQRALAALAEQVYGAEINRVTKVRDLRFVSEEAVSHVSGRLSDVDIVRSFYDDQSGLAEVTVRLTLDENGNPVPSRRSSVASGQR